MAELEDYGITIDAVRKIYDEYLDGAAKSHYLNKPESHGKVFSALVRTHLGIETEKRSRLAQENAKLRAMIRRHGISEASLGPRTFPTEVGHWSDEAFDFYAYTDMEPGSLRHISRRILDELVAPIESSGGQCAITVEIRGRIGSGNESLKSSQRAAIYDIGFSVYELE